MFRGVRVLGCLALAFLTQRIQDMSGLLGIVVVLVFGRGW